MFFPLKIKAVEKYAARLTYGEKQYSRRLDQVCPEIIIRFIEEINQAS